MFIEATAFDTACPKNLPYLVLIATAEKYAAVITSVTAKVIVWKSQVITLFPAPVLDIAQNKDNSGDQQTANQLLLMELALVVQLMPLGEVVTLLPVPDKDTPQNKDSSGDQHTLYQ